MHIFEQNGKEVFVLSSLINAFQVRPECVQLLLSDLTEHADQLQKVAMTSLVMGKLFETSDANVQLPGSELLWMNDPELSSAERLMVVMSAEANEGGGFSYGALNMVELQAKHDSVEENPLEALLDKAGDSGALLGLLGALAADAAEGCGEEDCPACGSEDQTEDNVAGETRVS